MAWALEVEVLGSAAAGRAMDAGMATRSHQLLDCALDLMRHLPPQQIQKNLSDLVLLSPVDQPLKIARQGGGKGFPFV